MSERIKNWWKLNGLAAAGISKKQWDELDAAIREDERKRIREDIFKRVKEEVSDA